MKYTEDLLVMMGHRGEPVTGAVFGRGTFAEMLLGSSLPSKAIEPAVRRIREPGRRLGPVRARIFHAVIGEVMWVSPGIYEWTRLEWIALWFRAMKTKIRGGRIPRARIVNTGAKK